MRSCINVLLLLLFSAQIYAHTSPVHFKSGTPELKIITDSFAQLIKKSPVPLSVEQGEAITVYFINPTRQISDYWKRNQIAFTHRLDELAIKYVLKSHDIKIKSNENQKRKLLQKVLASQPDFVVLTLDTATEADFIKALLEQSAARLIIQNVTTPIEPWNQNHPLIYVGFDHETGTQMLADHFTQTLLTDIDFAVNDFYPGYISQRRGQQFINMLETKSNFHLLRHIYTDATRGSASQHTRKLVEQYPQLDFIYASSTDIAIGTRHALKNLNREDILVNGWGGGSDELRAIQNGDLDVTVMRMNDDNGVAMAEAIKLVLENQEDSVPLVYSGEFKLITAETAPLQLDGYIQYAFRYSNRVKQPSSLQP